MKQWTSAADIHAPIEDVWELFDGSLEQMQKIMPQVIENEPIKVTQEVVGSVYRQKYQEGKRIEEYNVETLVYLDDDNRKKLKVGFVLAGMFEITAYYELIKVRGNQTHFTYTVTNRPLKWFTKLFLLFASDKVVVQFVDKVKKVAEEN